MSLAKILVLAVGIVLFAMPVLECAHAQADKKQEPFDLKPLLPPAFPLPPASQIQSGTLSSAPIPGDPNPPVNTTQTLNPPAPGFRITIPTK